MATTIHYFDRSKLDWLCRKSNPNGYSRTNWDSVTCKACLAKGRKLGIR